MTKSIQWTLKSPFFTSLVHKTMTNLIPDRRRHVRIPINADYQLSLDGHEYTGKVANISLSGAFLTMPTSQLTASCARHIGDLKINLDNERIVFKCEIVYVEISADSVFPAGIGVAFCNHDEDTATSIWNLAVGEGLVQKDFFHILDNHATH